MRRAVIALITVAALSQSARADRRSVALATPDQELQHAVATALEPWQIRVVSVDGNGLGADMPRSAERAAAIATERGVGAVVWISTDGAGDHALWIYDTADEHVVARRLGHAPPLDAVTAAAAALSVKTLLRHSAVTPPERRYGAQLLRRRRAPTTRLHFESSLGARLRSGDLEARLGLGVGWWALPHVAVGLVLRSGPGVAVDEAGFVGRFTDTALGIAAQARFDLGAQISVRPEAVALIDITELDGAVLAPDQRAHVGRSNPAAELAATVEWRALPELWIGARFGGGYLLRKQRYLVLGEPVLELPAIQWSAAVSLRMLLF